MKVVKYIYIYIFIRKYLILCRYFTHSCENQILVGYYKRSVVLDALAWLAASLADPLDVEK